MPEIEKGEGSSPHTTVKRNELTTNPALEGMNASGGGVLPKGENAGQGKGAADGNKPAPVDQATK
jgi:hypothetical protein